MAAIFFKAEIILLIDLLTSLSVTMLETTYELVAISPSEDIKSLFHN